MGTDAPQRLLPASVAIAAYHAPDARPRARTHAQVALPRGSPHHHRGAQSVLSGWAQYFRTGNARRSLIKRTVTSSSVCVVCSYSERARVALRDAPRCGVAPSLSTWALSPAWHRPVSGGSRNASTRTTTDKPCARNPHARFERASH